MKRIMRREQNLMLQMAEVINVFLTHVIEPKYQCIGLDMARFSLIQCDPACADQVLATPDQCRVYKLRHNSNSREFSHVNDRTLQHLSAAKYEYDAGIRD